MGIIGFYKKYYKEIGFIVPSILIVFIIRFLISFLPSFGFDMGSWLGWASRLSSLGFAKFYSDASWTQYTPGFMYYLWLIGKLGLTSDLAIKIPVLLTDLATGFMIWTLVRKVSPKLANISFFLYTLNPVVVFDGSVWGQIDGLLTLFLFIAAYFLIEKKSLPLSVLFFSLAFLIKPQSIAVAPVYLLVILLKKFKFIEIMESIGTGIATIFLLSWPFFVKNPIMGLPGQIIKMGNYYSYTSVFAYNIWSWVGFWKSDATKFLNISLSNWGVILLAASILYALFVFRKKINTKANYYLLFGILSLCFFVFPTKVHERYLFPFFAFVLTSAGLSKSANLFYIYGITSLASFLNLYYPYSYYYPTQLKSEGLYLLSEGLAKIIGFIFLCAYFLLLFWEKIPSFKLPKFSNLKQTIVKLPKVSLTSKQARIILGVILSFAFFSRVFNLGSPPNEYFDEVYHAFTAKVILSSDTAKAWEWWNTPPAGFAYEWTHPPLAKLGMVLGMEIFGQNSFGWRIPGALLGLGAVLMVYLIARALFEDEVLALLSAAAFSLDGLTLVMSRIGMNDSYILFFSLLSIYLFAKKKDFFSALSFGLAIASKWSAIWAVPIIGIVWIWRKKKSALPIILFILLPISVYLLSYIPMFLTGHSLSVWWEMQKQMWWYHTGLRATHPYSSPWWSWPFLMRPIYLYTSDEVNGMVSRIYAMGNPLVFWFGFAAVFSSMTYAFMEKNKKLGLVVFSYLIFFTPWALSPRIMFLYHYLPSIPFMCIAIGYVLRRNIKLIPFFFIPALLLFIYFYPHWAGLQIPLWLDKSYYWVPSWR
jgi:predicted membrane-bound dolichyl-phosphate-mannose-protein mannosyltransferase